MTRDMSSPPAADRPSPDVWQGAKGRRASSAPESSDSKCESVDAGSVLIKYENHVSL